MSATARVLITGGHGQLGRDLARLLAPRFQVSAPPRTELDVTDEVALDDAMRELRPAVVLNCAAFHNVDVCEREVDRSFQVNAGAVKRIAEKCERTDAVLVHFSTNYVFDGEQTRPYIETDRPNPQSVYAASKLAGEQMALAYASRALVVRTAGLYGLHGSASKGGNFVTRTVRRARAGESIAMVSDQRLSPTLTSDLADAVTAAVDAGVAGIVHITNGGACSWWEFTEAILDLAGLPTTVEPVPTTCRSGTARRPLNGVLAPSAAVGTLRPWREALADYVSTADLMVAG